MHYPKSGDFCINERYFVELDCKNKGFEQIKDIKNSFVAPFIPVIESPPFTSPLNLSPHVEILLSSFF
ncbi:MAG: hypothetical protein U9N33_10405 [Campylobacterota bacterium]|nr:hypothetical protein [Campylobacterota bacterium]